MEIKTRANSELLKGLRRKPSNSTVLLYSGGIDSTAAGLMLRDLGKKVHPLFINYNQSALEAERYATNAGAPKLGFEPVRELQTDLLSQLSKSSLLGGDRSIDDNDAWVPGRNTLFMVIAGIYAKQINADGIAIGYMLDDNFVFGDNDFFHHRGVADVLSRSFLQPMEVLHPTSAMTKSEVIQYTIDKKALDLTVSCWNAKVERQRIVNCNACANCVEKNSQLNSLGVKL